MGFSLVHSIVIDCFKALYGDPSFSAGVAGSVGKNRFAQIPYFKNRIT
jgi:hypothetical protein